MTKRVGVLAIQGNMEAHTRVLHSLGARVCPVLFERDLDDIDGLIIPGGESTTIAKGLDRLGLYEPLRSRIAAGLPVLGTCAGSILLAREVLNRPVPVLGALDCVAVRNAYGTQVDSFSAILDAPRFAALQGMRCVFIRAPELTDLGPAVEVLAEIDDKPVLVRQHNILAATFHPELSDDRRVHQLLLDS